MDLSDLLACLDASAEFATELRTAANSDEVLLCRGKHGPGSSLYETMLPEMIHEQHFLKSELTLGLDLLLAGLKSAGAKTVQPYSVYTRDAIYRVYLLASDSRLLGITKEPESGALEHQLGLQRKYREHLGGGAKRYLRMNPIDL